MGTVRKNIFITGGEGFIGKNLKEYFDSSHNVYAPSHSDLDLLNEKSVRAYIKEHKINAIVHCANRGGGRDTLRVQNTFYENIRMFFNVVRNAEYVEKIITMGSGAEYDIRHYKPKMSEEYFDSHIPEDDYGFSKYVCSRYAIAYNKNIVCLRLFGVFGKYEKYYLKFISNAIVKNIFRLPITIVQNTNFDYLYIDDLPKIVDHFLRHNQKEKAYNVVAGEIVDLLSIAKKVNAAGHHASEIIVRKEGMGKEYSGDNARLRAEITGLQFTPIDEAIRKLYSWYEAHKGSLDLEQIKKGDEYLNYSRVGKE